MTTYKEAGVDIEKKNLLLKRIKAYVKATHDERVISSETMFKGLVVSAEELKKFKSPVLAFNTDGVGTKTLLAAQLGKWEGIGEDIVNHCINDILTMGATPISFSDYIASSKLEPEVMEKIAKSVSEACKENKIIFVGGETAEMPGVYAEGAVDVVGFIMGAAEKDGLIDCSEVMEGNLIIGLESSGLHSNGFSLARKIVSEGKLSLTGDVANDLMKPHRSYLKATKEILMKAKVNGMTHITGGSFRKNFSRILPKGLCAEISKGKWKPLPIFRKLQEKGNIPEDEMYNIFNMGIGFAYIVEKREASGILRQLQEMGEDAHIIGKITKGEGVKIVD